MEVGHFELGDFYQKQGEPDKAYAEFNALVTSIPTEIEFYEKAATILLQKKEYDEALRLLKKSLQYKQNLFAYKWIGQIEYTKSKFKEAIEYLTKADLQDPQVVFNLSRSYYSDNQWNNGEACYLRLKNLSPKSEYLTYLSKLRTMIQIKGIAAKSK